MKRRTGERDHREAVAAAEARRLERVLRAMGPIKPDRLAGVVNARRWHGGGLEEAVRAGLRSGPLRRRPMGWLKASGR